ncbi:MAG: cell division protein FtsA [Parcubacteria group bacterium]|nr:cell division protein FtsA [Parcubacteria group bacterium]
MPKGHVITGLDIGNSAIKAVMVEIHPDFARPQVIGIGTATSNGMRHGMVVDMEEIVKDLDIAVNQAAQTSGVKPNRVYVNINGSYIRTQNSRGVIAVSRADNEISEADVQRVIEAASAVSLPPNREILHIIPRHFIVDGHDQVKNPIGMTGVRLEAEVMLIDVLSPYIKNLAKAVNQNNLEVAEFVFTPLAASRAVLDKKAREHGAMVLDIGGGLCSMAIFEEGDLVYTGVLPLGSRHITNDLAIVLRTSLDNAEQIKLEYGFVGTDNLSKKDVVNLSGVIGEEEFIVPKKQIAEVVEARVLELLDLVNKELKRSGKNLLPAGVMLTGGGIKLPGLVHLVKETLKLPVHLGISKEVDGIVNRLDDSVFTTAVGLTLWGADKEGAYLNKRHSFQVFGKNAAINKMRDWFKNFMP